MANQKFTSDELKSEEWRDVPGYEGSYQVSNCGRVRGIDRMISRGNHSMKWRGKIIAIGTLPFGHEVVKLQKNNRQKTLYIHDLVTAAFLGPKPEKHEVHHVNGNPADNRVDNLIYLTRQQHSLTFSQENRPRGSQSHSAKLNEDDVVEIRRLYRTGQYSLRELARKYGVKHPTILRIINRSGWKHI